MPAERAGIFIFNVSLRLKTKKMAEQEEKKEKKKLKLNQEYNFMVSSKETMEPIVDFKVNLLKLSLITLATVLILMVITAVVIMATPIKEYLPGYPDQSKVQRELYELNRRADSIELELQRKDVYFNNLKLVIEGYDFSQDSLDQHDIYAPLLGINTDTIELKHSPQDSALRAEFEEANLYLLNPAEAQTEYSKASNFFTPLIGTVVKVYNPAEGHYGVDVVSTGSQLIKATLDGTVVYASWTLDYGYTIGIQHENNYLSNYKHNATLLKKEGDFVKAGEAIAILGASGDLTDGTDGPELHFELWHNGTPMNPMEYINFEKGEE